jgi:hypothetical protein
MPNPFIQGFSGEIARHSANVHAKADEQESHMMRSIANTEELNSGFRCTAAQLNDQGHMNWADVVRYEGVERGRQQGDGVLSISTNYDNTIQTTAGLMGKHLNPTI